MNGQSLPLLRDNRNVEIISPNIRFVTINVLSLRSCLQEWDLHQAQKHYRACSEVLPIRRIDRHGRTVIASPLCRATITHWPRILIACRSLGELDL